MIHPAAEEITVEGILYALSDPVRARIYAQLRKASCAQNCATFLNIGARDKPLPKSTLSRQIKILREAGLIISERQGVEVQNRPRCDDLRKDLKTMIDEILKVYARGNGFEQ